MVFKRFYNDMLAQASYLVGCSATGEAVVVDPMRDVEQYLAAAEAEDLRITAVTETHIHADYLSGLRELAARTSATMYVSDEGGPDWLYEFRDEPGVVKVKGGDSIQVGNVRLDVVHTPGHTPEHISFMLVDEPASSTPMGAFTGDFVFVGDVGRPDLLERAANIQGTMEVGGRQLYSSLAAFKKNPDGLLIWPGHGAGSACGKSLGGAPVTSLGFEKASNWAFHAATERAFVDEVLSGQPEPPKYFAMMKKLNRQGPKVIGGVGALERMTHGAVIEEIKRLGQVIDVREGDQVEKGYIPGTISLPHTRAFLRWAGWFLDYERPIVLIAEDETTATAAARDLSLIGLDNVAGWTDLGVLAAYAANEGALHVVEEIKAGQLEGTGAVLVDVRGTGEYVEGHVPGSIHIPLGYLLERAGELPRDRKLALMCGSGSRSRLGLILLKRHGFCSLCNVAGGFGEYKSEGEPVEVGTGMPEPVGS
jgi:hydroxyacylglutathione hydrolase